MAKIKLSKGELKRQRDNLERFRHYLPTLQLKKQQLQIKLFEVKKLFKEKQGALEKKEEFIKQWIGLLADPQLYKGIDIKKWIIPERVEIDLINIAGANLPLFKEAVFPQEDYDLYRSPLWLDRGIKELRQYMAALAEVLVIESQVRLLEKELRVTTQRVNLFEKIKIPEALDAIRRIRIYLGDQQANAVGIGKVAKKKIEGAYAEEVLVA